MENLKVTIGEYKISLEDTGKTYYIKITPGFLGDKSTSFFENRRQWALKKFESLKDFARKSVK